MNGLGEKWRQRFREWSGLPVYQRFENLVALVVRLLINLVVLVALYRLAAEVAHGVLVGALDPLDPHVFQSIFGQILTVLIALEFNHTLHYIDAHRESIIQTKVVLLIALLALARKFIVLDLKEAAGDELLGLAAVTLSLGVSYWLVRDRDEKA